MTTAQKRAYSLIQNKANCRETQGTFSLLGVLYVIMTKQDQFSIGRNNLEMVLEVNIGMKYWPHTKNIAQFMFISK
jgi:hypothetical protein